MSLDNLSPRTRFWLWVLSTVLLVLIYAIATSFLGGDKEKKDPQAANAEQKAEKNEKATKEKEAEEKEKAEAKKEEEKQHEPAEDVKERLKKLLTELPPGDNEHTLGDDTTKLKVVFTERGAAIRTITLNEHEASDRLTGQRFPTGPDGKRPRLVLVTDDEDQNRNRLTPERQFELLSYRFSLLNEHEQATPELAVLPWKALPGATAEQISYLAEVPGRNVRITKHFKLAKDAYHVEMELEFAALDQAKPATFSYELSGPQGLPVEGLRWKQFSFRHYVFATQDADKPTTVYRTMEGVERLKRDGTPNSFSLNNVNDRKVFLYGGVMIQFFASLAVVDYAPGEAIPYRINKVLAEYVGPDLDSPEFYAGRQGRLTTRLISSPVTLEAEKPQSHKYLLYAGPSKALLLNYEKNVQPGLARRYTEELHLNQLTDATDVTWTSFFRVTGITGLLVGSTNLMHTLLENLDSFVGNYGIAIILMTVIVRLLLFPLSRKQAQNQAKMQEQMKILRPEMEKLKKQFANDRQQYALAQMELFKKHNMSPLAGCNGCWILLLQMPVFLGLYFALRESMHLRMSGFLWIENLAMPDMLLKWGDNFLTNLPSFLYLGPYLHLLPILTVVLMYMYQKLMAPPAMDEQQEQQIKMMNYMTLAMGLAFYWVASGLCLYFIVSSGWGMIERRFVKKAKEQAIADWQEKREKKANGNNGKPATGVKGKLGELWRDLQSKADKRK